MLFEQWRTKFLRSYDSCFRKSRDQVGEKYTAGGNLGSNDIKLTQQNWAKVKNVLRSSTLSFAGSPRAPGLAALHINIEKSDKW